MNDQEITFHLRAKVHNILTTCLDCAGIEPEQTVAPSIKLHPAGTCYYVDLAVENYNEEQLAYFVGFMTEHIGMKNIWFDCYPLSGMVCFELVFPREKLAR